MNNLEIISLIGIVIIAINLGLIYFAVREHTQLKKINKIHTEALRDNISLENKADDLNRKLKTIEDKEKEEKKVKINDLKIGDSIIVKSATPNSFYGYGITHTFCFEGFEIREISPSKQYIRLYTNENKEVWRTFESLNIMEVIKKKEPFVGTTGCFIEER